MGYSNVQGELNVFSVGNLGSLLVRGDSNLSGNLTVNSGTANFSRIVASNLTVTGNFTVTTTNTSATNALSINNLSTATALKVVQWEAGGGGHTHNVAEFWDFTTPALIIDPEGNLAIHTTVSPNYALTLKDGMLADSITSSLFSGNGSGLANLQSTSLIGALTSAQLQSTQSNITSVGTLTSLNVATFANIANIYTTNIVGFIGSQWTTVGSNLYYANAVSIGATTTSAATLSVTGNIYASNSIQAPYFTGYLATSSQPNITSVGTLTSLGVTNAVTATRFVGILNGAVEGANAIAGTTISGSLTSPAQLNITSVGTLTSLGVTNAVTATRFVGILNGAVEGANAIAGTTISGSLTTAAQLNITSVGTLTSLGVTNAVSATRFVGILNGAVEGANAISGTTISGSLTTAAQLNITSVGTLTSLGVTNAVTATRFVGIHNGAIEGANAIAGTTISGTTITGTRFVGILNGAVEGANAISGTTISGSLTTSAQGNITSVGTLISLGVTNAVTATRFVGILNGAVEGANAIAGTTISGSLTTPAQGNITSVGTLTSLGVTNAVSATRFVGILNGAVEGANAIAGTTISGSLTTAAQLNITSVGTLTSLGVTNAVTATRFAGILNGAVEGSNAIAGTTISGTTITGTRFVGILNGAVEGANAISGTTISGSLTTAAQLNITSVGTLTSLGVTNAVTATRFVGIHNGAIEGANAIAGTTISGTTITGTRFVGILNGAVEGANAIAGTTISGSLTTAAQPNITSVGTLTSLGVTNAVTATRFVGTLNGAVEGANAIAGTTISGSLTTAAQPNITSVGTLTSLGVTNAVTATRFAGILNGAVEGSNAIAGTTISGTTITGTRFVGILNGAVEGANAIAGTTISGSLTTAAQLNITSVGTLTSLGVTNAVTATRFVGILNGAVEGANAIAGTTISGSLTTAAQLNITSVGTLTSLNVSNAVTATRFVGILNGAVEGSNAIAGTTISGSLTTAAQLNITSVGTLTSLGVTNAVTATRFVGIHNGAIEGSNAIAGTTISGTTITGTRFVGILNGAVEGANAIAGTTISGSLTTAAQLNITSVGTLTSLGVTNAVTATRFVGILNGAVEGSNAIAGSTISGSLTTPAQLNITSVGTLTSLGVTNAVTATRFVGIHNGAIEGSNAIAGTTISGTTITGTRFVGILNGAVEGANAIAGTTISGSLTTPAQLNITSVGTLTSLGVTNAVTATRFAGILNGAVEGANAIAGTTISGSLTTPAQLNITSVGTLTSLGVTNAVTATRFAGILNGAVEGANAIAGTTISGSLTTPAQLNITSVGTLTSLGVTNAVTAARFVGIHNGAIEGANAIAGTTISGTTITGTRFVGILNGAVEGANAIAGTTISGSLTTAAQLNITSVGTLTSLGVTNAVTATRFVGILNGAVEGSNAIAGTTISGSLTTAAQLNITSVGTLTSLGVTNAVTATRFVGIHNGTIEGANAIAGTTISGSLTTSAQGNITSTGILTSLNVSGTSNISTLNIGTATVFDSAGQYLNGGQGRWTTAGGVVVASTPVTGGVQAFKTTGNDATWDGQLYSVQSYKYGAFATAQANQVNKTAAFGFDTSPAAAASYTNIDYAWYFQNDGNLAIYENGIIVGSAGSYGAYTTSTVLSLTFDGTNIIYWKDGVSVRTVARSVGTALYFDACFYNTGATTGLKSIAFDERGDVMWAGRNLVAGLGAFSNSITAPSFYGSILGSNTISASNIFSANSVTTANLTVTGLTNISNLQISGVSGTAGQVLTATGTGSGIAWGIGGGGGSSQWTGTAGSTIYYVPQVGIGSTATPAANLMVTGNIFASNSITTSNIFTGNITASGTITGTWTGANQGMLLTLGTSLTSIANFATSSDTPTLQAFHVPLQSFTQSTGAVSLFSVTAQGLVKFTSTGLYQINMVLAMNAPVSRVALGTNTSSAFPSVTNAYTYVYTIPAGTSPSAVITIPINVQNTALWYYLDVFTQSSVTTASFYLTASSSISGSQFGTYVQIAPFGNYVSSVGSQAAGLLVAPSTTVTLSSPINSNTYHVRMTSAANWTAAGASSNMRITTNGNIQFYQAGLYEVKVCLNASLYAVTQFGIGSSASDSSLPSTQGPYVYQYAPNYAQDPSTTVVMPLNITDTTKFYYLDVTFPGTTTTVSVLALSTFVSVAPIGSFIPTPMATASIIVAGVATALSGTYTATAADTYIGFTGGGTVTLPLGASLTRGKTFTIKDESGLAGTNTSYKITIQMSGTDLLDGYSSVSMQLNYAGLNIIWTGANSRWSFI